MKTYINGLFSRFFVERKIMNFFGKHPVLKYGAIFSCAAAVASTFYLSLQADNNKARVLEETKFKAETAMEFNGISGLQGAELEAALRLIGYNCNVPKEISDFAIAEKTFCGAPYGSYYVTISMKDVLNYLGRKGAL